MTVLVAVSGLPGSGKSTLARAIARELDLSLFELDHIDGPILQRLSGDALGWGSYEILTALADDNLGLGHGVVLDSVCWTKTLREQWADLAAKHAAPFRPIEVICSDEALHRTRLEARVRDIPGLPEIPWERVAQARHLYDPWETPRLVLDSVSNLNDLVQEAVGYVRG